MPKNESRAPSVSFLAILHGRHTKLPSPSHTVFLLCISLWHLLHSTISSPSTIALSRFFSLLSFRSFCDVITLSLSCGLQGSRATTLTHSISEVQCRHRETLLSMPPAHHGHL